MVYVPRAGFAAFLLAVTFGPPAAFGQPTGYPIAPPPVRVVQPPPQVTVNAGACLPPGGLSGPPPTTYPPGVYSPYGYPGYQGAVGGALSGYADVVNAAGQYQIQNQQSRIIQTQADLSRITYRQAIIAEQKYEKDMIPTTYELRQQQQWQKLQSARNNPTNTEIWSGEALNSLFTALQGAERQGLYADSVPLYPEVLQHINLSTGTASGAGAGMLKSLGNLDWPFALQDAPYMDGSAQIDALAKTAVNEIKSNGRVTADTFRRLNDAVNAMDDAVGNDKNLSPTDYIQSKGFLDNFQSSVQSLRDPNVASYFNGGYTAQGPTVADLVKQMTAQGLHFAPATQSDQTAYSNLYQALLTYDYRLAQLASR